MYGKFDYMLSENQSHEILAPKISLSIQVQKTCKKGLNFNEIIMEYWENSFGSWIKYPPL